MVDEKQDSEPWETLDVDDSELPFLRPCKRFHSRPLLPGPAAAVQSAMHRRDLHGDPVPTQECIRRAIDGDGLYADDDFSADPWLFAIDFLRSHRFVEFDCEVRRTPLSSIKNGICRDRVDLVVAIVKSCTRTGLGDMMVTLKDPTGTICASLHRKVLSKEEHGKNISVGSVLILKKIAVFAPSSSAYYLNITLSNVIKVIAKDSGPQLEQNYLPSIGYGTHDSESRKTTNSPNVAGSQERIQGIINNIRKNPELRGTVYSNKATDSGSVSGTSCLSNENRENPGASEKESLFTNQAIADDIVNIGVTKNNLDKDHTISVDEQPDFFESGNRDSLSHSVRATNVASNVVNVAINDEIVTEIGNINMQKPLVSSTAVGEWTEEQLNQLGVFDD